MFRVEVNGEGYKVFFKHCEDVERYTVCRIDGCEFSAEGMAICGAGDNYVRSVGRKLSMTRTLDSLGFNKLTRSKFWEQYFLHCK